MPMGANELARLMMHLEATDAASPAINKVTGAAAVMNRQIQSGGLRLFAYSQAWGRMGQSMQRTGAVITGLAVISGKFMADFGHEMALAQTQAQLSQKEFGKLQQSALKTSSTYGVAATDIGRSLYDIFSTTEANAKSATKMVNDFAKASVAGSIDISEATRGVVDIQNAFGKSAGDTTDVLDLQFKMLRKSAGTYEELVSAFGNVIGAGSQMNQELRSVAGAVSFLTLRGRTQAQASISVSRALDQISRSAADVKKVLGVAVFDAAGNFRQLGDIINDMGEAMEGMTSRERATAFEKMFGAGSIQANRFFRLAVPQFEALNKSIDEMAGKKIGGEFEKAFQIIKKNDPSFVINRLKETFKNIGISIMMQLAPALRSLADQLSRVLDWFTKLDPETKKMIGTMVLLAGPLLIINGTIFRLIGSVTGMISIFRLAGLTFGRFALTTGFVMTGILAIAAAVFLIIKNWDKFSAWWERNWNKIKLILIAASAVILLRVDMIASAFLVLKRAIFGVGAATGVMAAKSTAAATAMTGVGVAAGTTAKRTAATAVAARLAMRANIAWAGALALVGVAISEVNGFLQQQKGFADEVNKSILAGIATSEEWNAAAAETQSNRTWNPFEAIADTLNTKMIREQGQATDEYTAKVRLLGDAARLAAGRQGLAYLNEQFGRGGMTVGQYKDALQGLQSAFFLYHKEGEKFIAQQEKMIEGLGRFANELMDRSIPITDQQRSTLEKLIPGYRKLGINIDKSRLALIENLLATGKQDAAITLLKESIENGMLPILRKYKDDLSKQEIEQIKAAIAAGKTQKAVDLLTEALKRVPKKTRADVEARIHGENALAALEARLIRMGMTTYTANLIVQSHRGTGGLRGVTGTQTGGRTLTEGIVRVGEKGPELLRLPAGARVIPLSSTDKVPATQGNTVTVNLYGGDRETARRVADELDWLMRTSQWG